VATGVIVKAVIAGVLGLIALLASLIMSVRIGRGLIRDLRRLRLDAHEASGVRLPSVMRRLSAGEQVDVETEVPRLEYDKNEIGEVGQALNTLQRAAVEAAVKQSELRDGVSEVFVNLARRSQVLLHKQLTLLDTMERRTEDTDELADLFRLDHLTTRMRRHAEGLVILSGAAPSRQWRKPVQLMDIVRAAVAEVEDYERIEVRRLPRVAVTGPAVADLTHLVAELLENATVFSPPHTAVQVIGERVANGFTLEIHDRGLGMAAEALLDANLRLAETPEFELSDTDRLGLFVVSRLAQRQNVRVSLQPSPYGGTTAVVFIPDALLTDDIPDTNGIGFRLDRALPSREGKIEEDRKAALSETAVRLPGLPASILDGPVELEAPVDLDSLGGFPGPLDDEDAEQGGLFRARRSIAGVPVEQPRPHQQTRTDGGEKARSGDDDHSGAPVPLPRRRTPKLVSSHGRPVTRTRPRRGEAGEEPAEALKPVESLEPALERVERQGVVERASAQSSAARRTDRTETSGRRNGERAETAGLRAETAGPRSDGPGRREAPALPRRTRPTGSSSGTAGTTRGSAAATQGAESGASPRPTSQSGPAVEGRTRTARRARQGPHPEGGGSRRSRRRRGTQPDGLAPAGLAAGPREERRGRRGPGRHSTRNDKGGRSMTAPKATGPTATSKTSGELNWLLDDLVDRVASIRKAIVLSGDGLATGASKDLTREDSEHLAAVASGFHSLAKGVGRHFEAGGVRQTVVELEEAFLFVTAAGDGSCLAVLSDADSDVGQVAYEMTLLVKRVGAHLAAAPRTDLPAGG
jgi:predicted regulator of Ras-like GTPase activity (Roadblock/LC7/MglB family)